MDTEIWVALIALAGTNAASLIAYLRERTATSLEPESEPERPAPRVLPSLREWSQIKASLSELIDNTVLDRFLLFEGTNGKTQVRTVTAWLQMRVRGQQAYDLKNFRVDDPYREVLNRARTRPQGVYITTSDLEDSALKRICEVEGITSSVTHHIADVPADRLGNITVVYFLVATQEGGMDKALRTKIEMLASRMRILFAPESALLYQEHPGVLTAVDEDGKFLEGK